MLKVAVTGLGFMGNMHARCYKALESVKLAAICDVEEERLKGEASAAGNIPGTETPLDLTGIELYSSFDEMLEKADLDAVSITLPTYMHAEYAVKALEAGVNVLCEKPMAPDLDQCEKMIAAAKKSGKVLQIGHCVRFWPEYAKTKEIIDSGEYGKIKAATFQRLSLTPTWSWTNWLMDQEKSGGAILDLHIHDSDFIQYLLGMPKAVCTRAVKGPSGGYDHIVTEYIYDDEPVITAEGGWIMTPGFGFEMSFNIMLEKATITYDCTRDPAFKVCPDDADAFTPEVATGDGYSIELAHFAKAVAGEKVPPVTTPQQSKNSVRIILAEKESMDSGKKVSI